MSKCSKRIGLAAALAIGVAGMGSAGATTITMGFDELVPNAYAFGEYVANYYDGGCATRLLGGANGTCGGPDWGVRWSNAVVGTSPAAQHVPSPPNYVTGSGSSIVMNVAAGFTDALTFGYAAPRGAGTLNIYSGLDGTGALLASFALPSTNPNKTCNLAAFTCWNDFTATFAGVAESVVFGGSLRFMGFDNVSFALRAASQEVAEPEALALFGLGTLLIGLGVAVRRRRA